MESGENSMQSLHPLSTAAAHPLAPLCLSPYIYIKKNIIKYYFFIFEAARIQPAGRRL
jgi:hypothetical protein